MDVNHAAMFLTGSILFMLGLIVVFCGIIVINNILHKFWKPVKWTQYDISPRFITEEEAEKLASGNSAAK